MDAIPADFPRRTLLGSLSGTTPKLSVRLTADGMYTNAMSDEEYLQAYENAEDLAQHLKTYVLRKEQERPDWGREGVLDRVRKAVDDKFRAGKWDIVPEEQEWVMKRVVQLLA